MEQHKNGVLPGALNLMVLKTLKTLGPLHGYGIARRIEQISGNLLQLNQGTIYPAFLHLEQMGSHQLQMGRVGKQPARQVLLDH
jgi:PadR family transcriptional regulator, regulatory protein PadR